MNGLTHRWITAISSLALVGVSAIAIPMATNISHLIFPHFGLGLGIGNHFKNYSVLKFLNNFRYNRRRNYALFGQYSRLQKLYTLWQCLRYRTDSCMSGIFFRAAHQWTTHQSWSRILTFDKNCWSHESYVLSLLSNSEKCRHQ